MNKINLKYGGIYKIINRINKKVYIGQVCTKRGFRKRFNDHKKNFELQKGVNKHIQNSWNKYGAQNFEYKVLEKIKDDSLLTVREQYWVNIYNSLDERFGYNKRISVDSNIGIKFPKESCRMMSERRKGTMFGKNNNFFGKKHSEESKRKMSQSRKNNSLSEDTKKRISESLKGHIVKKETRMKISNSRKGIIFSEKTRRKMSFSKRGEKGRSTKLNWEKVKEIRKEYSFGKTSHRILAEKFNVSKHAIYDIIHFITWKIDSEESTFPS